MEIPKKFSKILVTLIIVLNIVFTGFVLYLFYLTGNEPAVLIGAWFAFTTGELWLLASIKKKEITGEAVMHVADSAEDNCNDPK